MHAKDVVILVLVLAGLFISVSALHIVAGPLSGDGMTMLIR